MTSQKTLDEYIMKKETPNADKQPIPQYKITGFYKETLFQETEIGKIPKEWRLVKFKEVSEIRKGERISESVKSMAFIPMEAIPDNSLYAKYELRSVDEVKSYVYCEPGDILLAKITPSFENGKQGIVPEELQGKIVLATTEVYPIKCKNIDKYFLFYLLKYSPIRSKLVSLMRGTTGRKRVPREALEELLLPHPPITEQRRIAEILSTVDKTIEGVDGVVTRLERLKKALMRELLTGRVRVREEDGRLVFHRETQFQETPIGKIPGEWQIVRIGDVTRIETRSLIPAHGAKYYYIGLEDIESDTGRIPKPVDVLTDGAEIKSAKYVFTSKHVLYGKLRPYLNKVALPSRDGICSTDILPILPDIKLILREYLAYVLRHERFVTYATARMKGTNHPRVNPNDVLEYKFPLPPISEQQEIVNTLINVDKWIEYMKRRKEKLERLKRGLMDLLLTGRVRVRVKPASS